MPGPYNSIKKFLFIISPKSGMIYLTHIYIQKGAIHFDYQ